MTNFLLGNPQQEESFRKPKIGFYLGNGNIPNADLRFPENGNPGIGGSEYGLVTLPYFLSLYFHDFDLVIYANVTKFLPYHFVSFQANNSVNAAQKAILNHCQILVVRLCDQEINLPFIKKISESNIKIIVWAQNEPSPQQMDLIALCDNISRLVCAGREELDLVRDYPAFNKTTYIFNGINSSTYTPKQHIIGHGNTVVYMGSLMKEKGFHLIAEIWPQVKARVPGARLVVIGSGNLYNENFEVGRWGIAEENYEKLFRRFISDKNGNPDSSVKFLGKLGSEKIPIIQQADIGVVNPNKKPSDGLETFCWSAVEIQACGTPVISVAAGGLLDSVSNRYSGILVRNPKYLANQIVNLLENEALRKNYGQNAMEYVRSNFDFKKICDQWNTLFCDVINLKPNKIFPLKSNIFYRYKYLRETMRLIKLYIPFLRNTPSISAISNSARRKVRFYIKLNSKRTDS